MILRIFGIALVLALIGLALGFDYALLIDLPTFLQLFGLHFAVMLIQYGTSSFKAWKAVFTSPGAEEQARAVEVWERAGSVFIAVGILLDILGQVMMGAHSGPNPQNAEILTGHALSLLGTFWGMVFAFAFCAPVTQYLKGKAPEATPD